MSAAWELDDADGLRFGSRLMRSCSPDEHGWPYQVVLRLRPGGGTFGPLRDAQGEVLVYVLGNDARPLLGENGRPIVCVAPPDVAEAAQRS